MRTIFFISFLFCGIIVSAQKNNKPIALPARPVLLKADLQKIRKMEDTLRQLSDIVLYDSVSVDNRKKACYAFIPKFLSALKINNSFYYKLDSIPMLATIYPPDSSFRIFTWQLHYPKGRFRYFGVMQMKSSKLKIFPLKDLRDTLPYHTQKILTPDNWYGALYYKVIENMVNKKPVYTLFGFEATSFISRRKVIDVLTFDDKGNPQFGAPIFHFKYTDSVEHARKMVDTMNRFFLDYKWSASVGLNYDKELELIVYDHVTSPNPRARDAGFTFVQDGDYQGFKWTKDRWQFIDRVFTFSIGENDNPPIPAPLFGIPQKQPKLPDSFEKP